MTLREVVAAVLTVAGLAAGVAAGFTVSATCGLFVLGAGLLLLGFVLGTTTGAPPDADA